MIEGASTRHGPYGILVFGNDSWGNSGLSVRCHVMPTKYDPDKHHRRSIRIKHYDYSTSGNYFVTICLQNRACLLGKIVAGKMQLNDAGLMVQQSWVNLPNRFSHIVLDTFVVMPNHFHGIIILPNSVEAPFVDVLDAPCDASKSLLNSTYQNTTPQLGNSDRWVGVRSVPTRKLTLGQIVGAFKSMTTHDYIVGVHQKNWHAFHQRLWQRNYYEHIIRNNDALQTLRHYITLNPEFWENDQLHLPHY